MKSKQVVVFLFLICSQSGSANQPDGILFFDDFESSNWAQQWQISAAENFTTVSEDPGLGFEPRNGKALRVRIQKGSNQGGSLRYPFAARHGKEPEEIYFYYDLRLASDWTPHHSGKFPGPAGTYGSGGWGGRPNDGYNGWSARGLFRGIDGNGNTRIGNYVYTADGRSRNWEWNLPAIERNRWYGIEQYIKMNTPGEHDGILRAWVDGELVYDRTNVYLRNTTDLKIETIWMNFWHGGGDEAVARSDHTLYVDNVVISANRISGVIINRPITVTAQHDTKVYDGSVDSAVVPELTAGTLADGHSGIFTQVFDAPDAGTGKTLTPSATILDGEGEDVTHLYDITLASNITGVITNRILTLSNFTADWKFADGTTAVTGTGFDDDRVEGDDLEFTYEAAFADAKPGLNKPVLYTSIAISGGADQGNYILASTEGEATAGIGIMVVEATGSTQIEVPRHVGRIGALLVGGGGGGGGGSTSWRCGGGGGAGGVKFKVLKRDVQFEAGDTINVTVGARGSRGGENSRGSSGGNSALSIGGSTVALAHGGGGGANRNDNGRDGGSGGGGSTRRNSGYPGAKIGDCIGSPGFDRAEEYEGGGGGGAGAGWPGGRIRHGWRGITLAELADQTPYDPAVHPDLEEVPGLEQFAAGGGAGGDPGGLGGDVGGGRGRASGFHGGDATNWGSGGGGGYHDGRGGHGYQGIVVLYFEFMPQGTVIIIR